MAGSSERVAEAQWSSFCSNVIADWSGSWTFWDPSTGTVKGCFDCVRSFKALNEEKTIVLHQNISDRPLRPGQSGPWEIHKEDTDGKGFRHPAFPKARAVLHANGGGVLTNWKLTDSDSPAFEIYLCRGEHRCSVIVLYDESKQLRSFGAIREKQTGTQSSEIWSSSAELQEGFPHCDFNKDFTGVEKTFDDNLQLSVVPDCKWDKDYWMGAKEMGVSENLVFKFLPDTICLSCPSRLTSNSFSLRACVLFSNGDEKELQELTLTFVDGNLTTVKQGLYH